MLIPQSKGKRQGDRPEPLHWALQALRHAAAAVVRLPPSDEATSLRDRCVALERATLEQQASGAAGAEHDALLRSITELHVAIARVYRGGRAGEAA